MRILYFDDDPGWHNVVRDIFEEHFYLTSPIIQYVSSPMECIDALKQNDFNICILDVMMNGHPVGLDLLKNTREHHPDVKCIMLSSDNNAIFKSYAAGCKAYLHKDHSYEEIQSLPGIIERVLVGEKVVPGQVGDIMAEQLPRCERRVVWNFLDDIYQDIIHMNIDKEPVFKICDKLHISEQKYKDYVDKIMEKMGTNRFENVTSYFEPIHNSEI